MQNLEHVRQTTIVKRLIYMDTNRQTLKKSFKLGNFNFLKTIKYSFTEANLFLVKKYLLKFLKSLKPMISTI